MPNEAIIVYTGRDNEDDRVLLANDAVYDTTPITRWSLTVGGLTLDTSIDADWIEWPFTILYQGASVKGARLKLGSHGLLPGIHADCQLVVYEPLHPNGVVWSDGLKVRVM